MADYEIIDVGKVPVSKGKWVKLFSGLPLNKAVKFKCKDKKEAERRAISIYGSLRQARTPIKVKTRRVDDGDGQTLFVWRTE